MKTFASFLIVTVLTTALSAHTGHHHSTSKDHAIHEIMVEGDGVNVEKIRRIQQRLRTDPKNASLVENLGWLFISLARVTSEHEYYEHATRCAKALTVLAGGRHQGQLMLGHLYLQEHRFDEAAAVAGALVKERGWHYDQGLLGDVLMDLGDLPGAIAAYDAMMQQRPGLESFARAALVRWQRGQLDPAIEAMELAVSAGSLRNPEPLAWAYAKLAGFYLQKADHVKVERVCQEALRLVADYPHAQLMLGRMHLAQDSFDEAVPLLEKAAETLPEPFFLWALRDGYQAIGDFNKASEVDERLHATGAAADPRTYALFLATTQQHPAAAYRLANKELTQRQDIFTFDALAWSAFANGDIAKATSMITMALKEGTKDARLSLHAGLIAARSGRLDEARSYLSEAEQFRPLLLPSELKLLRTARAELAAQS